MKDKTKNSRIIFKKAEADAIKKAIKHWIEIENEKFKGSSVYLLQPTLDLFNSKTVCVKDEYTFNLNFSQLKYVHGAVAEEYLDYKKNSKAITIKICRNIENILNKNYKFSTADICYPCDNWS